MKNEIIELEIVKYNLIIISKKFLKFNYRNLVLKTYFEGFLCPKLTKRAKESLLRIFA